MVIFHIIANAVSYHLLRRRDNYFVTFFFNYFVKKSNIAGKDKLLAFGDAISKMG
jgi:hypothetical protein